MTLGWVIIFIQFHHHIDFPNDGLSQVHQKTEVVYQTLKECSDNVLKVAKKTFPDQKFKVEFTGSDEEGIEVQTLNQSTSFFILHHNFKCMEIRGSRTPSQN